MIEIHWTRTAPHGSSPRAREYLRLVREAEQMLRIDWPSAPTSSADALHLLDRLASFLNAQLLPGDYFALDSELLHLLSHPLGFDAGNLIVAASRSHLHLLRYLPESEAGLLEVWSTPLRGVPAGLFPQLVGYLGSYELVAISREDEHLRETRLAFTGGRHISVIPGAVRPDATTTALGQVATGLETHLQLEVCRTPGLDARPFYQLRLRRHAADSWRILHTARHPLRTPLFDGHTIYFSARANQIMAIEGPLSDAPSPAQPVLALETPSPLQALVRFPSPLGPTLLAATSDGTMFAIDPKSRRLLWKFDSELSLSSVAVHETAGGLSLVIGRPDGVLELLHPVDPQRLNRLVAEMLGRLALNPERLLELAEASPDLPFLRLLAVDRVFSAGLRDGPLLSRLRTLLLQCFDAARRGGPLTPADVLRFLSYQCFRFADPDGRDGIDDKPVRPDEPLLGMLFSVLETLSGHLIGDSRRRLERLLRRLREDGLGAELYEHYRSQHAPSLTFQHLAGHSLKHEAQRLQQEADAAQAPEPQATLLMRALSASWCRYLTPVTRAASLQGIFQAVRVLATPAGQVDPGEAWLIGMGRDGLPLFRLAADRETPEPHGFYPLAGGHRLTSGPLLETHADVVAVAGHDTIVLLRFEVEGDVASLRYLPVADLELEEPVTALKVLEIPTRESTRPFVPALAVGQADGRLRLLQLEPVDASAEASLPQYRWRTLLDETRPAPVHHVALCDWPDRPALLVGADPRLSILKEVYFEGMALHGTEETLELEASVTAFTVAWPPPRLTGRTRPILVVGLANGMVQAFQPATVAGQAPELCWLYRAPQVITDLAFLPDPSGGWFVAAADNGELHLLRYGEPHHRVTVERFPYDLTTVVLPWGLRPHLLVSSPAGATTLLEVTGVTAAHETETLVARLEALLGRDELLRRLERAEDSRLLALAVHLARSSPLETLIGLLETHHHVALQDATFLKFAAGALLARAGEEPEARTQAEALIREALGHHEVPATAKVHLLQVIGERLDRIEEAEIDLLLTPLDLDDIRVARAYLEMLEHLWARFHATLPDDLVWWRGMHRLMVNPDRLERRQLQPSIGIFARKLLKLSRENVIEQLGALRRLEAHGLYLAAPLSDALSPPHVLGDGLIRDLVKQYGRLLRARTPAQLQEELAARRDLMLSVAPEVPRAHEAGLVYEGLTEAFEFNDYDQYSRFLVDAPEFLPQVRSLPSDLGPLLGAFQEVRSRLTAVAPAPFTDRDRVTRFQDRVQALVAQAEVLSDAVRRWGSGATLEQQIAAALLGRWREKILLPEIHRLQESVELVVRDLRVVLPEDGGLAEVSARIHNLGGRPLEGLMAGLDPGPDAAYLWEGTAEWCQGPVSFGQGVEYRTEVLLEEGVEDIELDFELRYLDHGQEIAHLARTAARVEREEAAPVLPGAGRFREEAPLTFEALRQALLRMEAGRVALVLAEEVREREQVALDLANALGEGVDSSRRVVLVLDLPGMLEGPPRAALEELPAWWLPDRLARALFDRGLLAGLPERVELRADPRAALDRMLHRALEAVGELWFVLRRGTRAFAAHPPATIEQARRWLHVVLEHPSHRIRVIMPGDFSLAVRMSLPPSPLAGRVDLLDVDRPCPFDSPRSRDEFQCRLQKLLTAARLQLSDLMRHKLIAHAGWNLPILRRLIARLEGHRGDPWLQYGHKLKEQQGEPDELEPFLRASLPAISRPFKERLRVLGFFHRLALAAVASGRVNLPRRELREGMVLAEELWTMVKARGNRPKRLYTRDAVLLEGDVQYLQVTVGEIQGRLDIAMFRTPNYSFSLSHLLAVVGLPRLLADLEALGLIRHTSSAGAPPPFVAASPLLRRWLYTAHPFEPGEEAHLRTRLAEDASLPELIPLSAYVEVSGRLSSTGQLADFLVFLGLLEEETRKGPGLDAALRRWERLLGLARRVVAWKARPSQDGFRVMLAEWATLFGCRVEPLEVELEEGVFGVAIDLAPLRIPRLGRAVVFGMTRELSAMRAERLREAVRRAGSQPEGDSLELPTGAMGFTLLPPLTPGVQGQAGLVQPGPDAWREMLGDRLIPLSERDLTGAALAEDGRRAFLDLLARGGFRFQHLSPYHLLGPLKGRAMDVLFVGREREIDDVLRHPDQQFAIVGSRKIGKTSLLLKLKQELSLHLGEKARVLYIDCATLTPEQTWRSLTDGLNLKPVGLEDARVGVRRQLENLKHPVVLLLDEIDGLYDLPGPGAEEAAERLMWDLRSLAAAGVLRLILAGYVRVYERRLDPRSAFHNFTTFRRLGALTPEAARQLVRGPMGSLDIELASEGLIDLILDRTWRVPWIMQLFCHQLIMKLDERLTRSRRFDRRILREDVDGVSVQIEEELYTHFTSARVMSVAEQVLLLTMVEAGVGSFTEEELRARLEARFGEEIWRSIRYEDLPRALDNLTLTLALTVESGVYSFPLEMYPTVVRSRLGNVTPRLDRLAQNLRRDLEPPL